jgi:hypothetical protein
MMYGVNFEELVEDGDMFGEFVWGFIWGFVRLVLKGFGRVFRKEV